MSQHVDHLQHITALERLMQLHSIWAEAQVEIQEYTGRPLCVSNCGLCCKTNTVLALGVEADYAASTLVNMGPLARGKVLDRIRNWLLEPALYTIWPGGGEHIETPLRDLQANQIESERRRLALEISVMVRGPCPLLDEDMQCMVHEARPLVCRAYGVTRLPGTYCLRPAGIGETPEYRAIWEGPGAQDLWAKTKDFLRSLEGQTRLYTTSPFPTAIYQRFRGKDFERIKPSIPVARMFTSNAYTAVLFQAQDDGQTFMSQPVDISRIKFQVA